jgi:hypothetical protein
MDSMDKELLDQAKKLNEALLATGLLSDIDKTKYSLIQKVNMYCANYQLFGGNPLIYTDTENIVEVKVGNKIVKLSIDQKEAIDKIFKWLLKPDEPYFVLKGYAGTGKTFLLQLLKDIKDNIYFSAPTNKATKVLIELLGPTAKIKTTYSTLGLRMEQVEDELRLTQSETPPYFPKNSVLVIDEASMCGKVLCSVIDDIRLSSGIKILYVGDPAQLPPVGEDKTRAWKVTEDPNNIAVLKKIVRHDNQLLTLASAIRNRLLNKDWSSPLKNDHTTSGVWMYSSKRDFEAKLLNSINTVDDLVHSKVIAWRNKTVEYYNNIIRQHLGFKDRFCINEIILIAEPIEQDKQIIAYVDDEYRVERVEDSMVIVDNISVPVTCLTVKGDKTLFLNIPKDVSLIDSILNKKALKAKWLKGTERKDAWSDFWRTKSKFNKVRYGYALTAHRAQGSTYKEVYVDQQDILANSNKREAMKCLYVSCTRPTTNLYSY